MNKCGIQPDPATDRRIQVNLRWPRIMQRSVTVPTARTDRSRWVSRDMAPEDAIARELFLHDAGHLGYAAVCRLERAIGGRNAGLE